MPISLLRLEPGGKQAVRVKVVFGKSFLNQNQVRTGSSREMR
jgi:hypothetical protein